MNLFEAYNILGVDQNASEEDVKKAFRTKAAQKHPDKPNGSEEEFKKINQAYQEITNKPKFSGINFDPNVWVNFSTPGTSVNPNDIRDAFFNFHNTYRKQKLDQITLKITFSEYVLGCKKEIEHTHNVDCCLNKDCNNCNGTGKKNETIKVVANILPLENRVVIPAAKLIVKIIHEKENDLVIINNDVHSSVEISLLEALKGTKKKIKTVKGEKTLSIFPGIKNDCMIKIAGFGVGGFPEYHHVVRVRVNYPEKTKGLIEYLEKEGKE